jgi:hypothetical protein
MNAVTTSASAAALAELEQVARDTIEPFTEAECDDLLGGFPSRRRLAAGGAR